ncbi:hypothetical protein PENTCL1PPCAC_17182, partial [Pristionchus entomophagus]
FILAIDDSNAVRSALAIARPEYLLEDYEMEGVVNIFNWGPIISLSMFTGPIAPITVLVFVLRAKVLSKIIEKANQMSLKTMKLHSALTKVLSIQAVLPVIFLFSLINYYLCQSDIFCSPVQEHLILWELSQIGSIVPMITLYYVQPYRSFLEEKLLCKKAHKTSFVD